MEIFAPASSRVIRVLLSHPKKPWTAYGLAKEAGVAYSRVHELTRELLRLGVCRSVGAREFVPARPEDLLDQWAHYYSYARMNGITSYYSPESNLDKFLKRLGKVGGKNNLVYALTLHTGMSLVHAYVRPVDVHFYVEPRAEEKWVEELELELIELGGNVHLAKPFDRGVFYKLQEVDGLKIASNLQLYLDLFNYPARGREAAGHLKKFIIEGWEKG